MSLTQATAAHRLPHPAHAPLARQPRLTLVPPYEVPAPVRPAIYWKRRLVALIVLTVLAVGVWSLARSAAGLVSSKTDSPAAATTGLGDVSPVASPTSWTVRPGDTLWSIARAVKPSGDIRPVLTPLMKQYSGKPLQVGEAIAIPAFKG